MSDIVERLEALARAEHDDLSVASEAASRIRELEGEVEGLRDYRDNHYVPAALAENREIAKAYHADNERLREALAFYASAETWKASGHPQIDADTKPILRDGGKRARAALKGDTNDA